MSKPAVYRFLPWTRRGLISAVQNSDAAESGPLPFRETVTLDVTLTGGTVSASTSAAIAGPGDVIGVDASSIVRTTPGANASNVEPNYLVAVDFDDPDLPWVLTPSAANSAGKLRPWLALVVVEKREGVSLSVAAGAPLPRLTIESGAQRELPPLEDSWAWAHTQLLVEEGSGAEAAPTLASDPDRHVSRLLCPRRLTVNTDWLGCLVPAFDAGVRRGLGLVPDQADLAPAWTDQDSITLPVYFSWEFSTGASGDFESLVRKLQPVVITSDNGTPTVGTVKMHIGAAGGQANLPTNHPGRVVHMDGALRALQQLDGTITDIPAELRSAIGQLLDEIADASGSDPDDGAVGPPLYGSWAANRFSVMDSTAGWFRELNLDVRTRVAAGLGSDVVRREQEDLMTAAWQQIGEVMRAASLLSRSRLSIEASSKFYAKTILRLGDEETLSYAEPLANRTPLAAGTVRTSIAPTSLPDAAIDPAMRRLMSPINRYIRKGAGTAGADPQRVTNSFMAKLSAGTNAVDPTDFVPAALAPPIGATLDDRGGQIDLAPVGLPVVRSTEEVAAIVGGVASFRKKPAPLADERLRLRADLRSTGLVTSRHLAAVRSLPVDASEAVGILGDRIISLRQAAVRQPHSSGFLLSSAEGRHVFTAVDISSRGTVEIRTEPTTPNVRIGRTGGRLRHLPEAVTFHEGALAPGQPEIEFRPGANVGDVSVVRDDDHVIAQPISPPRGAILPGHTGPAVVGPSVTVPPLVRDSEVIGRFERAIDQLSDVSSLDKAPPSQTLVSFGLANAATALTARSDPGVAHTARVATMVRFGSKTLGALLAGDSAGGVAVPPEFDRVMAYPVINDPAYRMLANLDRSRLLPGVDQIPPDSVTLLETNPRFVNGFMVGLNHELNRELLWRRFPTDQRATPMRRFWDRIDGAPDVPPIHQWRPLTTDLAQFSEGKSNLVLLIRGELFRRYPNTVVIAIKSTDSNVPSSDDADIERPVFAGLIDPDISFFGFDLTEDDIRDGTGWFFALQEQITEPRFGLDQTIDPDRGALDIWRAAAWPDTPIEPGATFNASILQTFATSNGLSPSPATSAQVAEALFQNPVQVIVHGKHLTSVDGT